MQRRLSSNSPKLLVSTRLHTIILSGMKLIVGLGNPGKEYERTRHNAGFVVVDALSAEEHGVWSREHKLAAEVSRVLVQQKRALLLKPTTFMNNSGRAVRDALAFYKLTPAELLVIHDEKDIPLGTYRIQSNRGPAGHNGVRSIIEELGTQDFMRIRVGVAPERPEDIKDTAGFVLGKFTPEEERLLHSTVGHVLAEVARFILQ